MTSDASAEATMRATCDAIMAGDLMTAMGAFTPDALSAAMALGSGLTAAPSLTGYTIEALTAPAGEQRFRVRFTTTERELSAAATWQQIEGVWLITAIALETPPG